MCTTCKSRPFALRFVDGKWWWTCWDGHLMFEEAVPF